MEVFPIASLQMVFDVLARDNASGAFRNIGDSAEHAGKRAEGFGSSISGAMKVAAGALAAVGIGAFLTESVQSLARIERINTQTATVIKSTGGAAQVTTQHIIDLTGEMENLTATEAESIQQGANLLLTFTNIKNGVGDTGTIFDDTVSIMNDMARAMDTTGSATLDTSKTAIQLGKALNDPIKGITALSKVGVSFSDQQKDQIRTMVEAGNVAGAQSIILQELQKEFGGSAEAFAQTTAGKIELAKHALGTFGETISSSVLPVVANLSSYAADAFNGIAEGFSSGEVTADGFEGAMQQVGTVAADLFDAIGDLVSVVGDDLAGAFQTFGPALGSALSLFGDLVGIVGDVVGFFADLPGPVLLGVGALTAFILLKGPIASVFETIALKAMYASEAVGAAGLAGAASGLVGFLGGPWGIAIGAATIGLGFLTQWLSKSSDAGADMAASQKSIADALKQSNGAIDDNVRRVAAQQVVNSGLATAADRWGISLSTLTDAVLGVPDAMAQAQGAASHYKNALDNLDGSYGNVGDSIGTAKTQSDDYLATLNSLAGGTDQGIQTAQQLAAAMGESDAATGGAVTTTAQYTQGLQDAVDAAKDAQDQTNLLKSALDALTGANVSVDDATASYYSALRTAKESLGDLSGEIVANNGYLNLQTEAGSEVKDRLEDLASSSHGYLAALKTQGAGQDEVAAKDQELRDSFYQTALQLTGNDTAARNLTDRYYGIPNDIHTTVTADTGPAQSAIDGLLFKYNGHEIFVHPGVNRNTTGVFAATGGYIAGPGSATSDSIPAWLSNGEYVVKAASVGKYGTDFMDALNAGQIAHFAGGGLADGVHVKVLANTDGLAAQLAAAQGGTPGGGSVGGAWGSIWQWIKDRVPQARINSTYRAGDPGYHGQGKAVDLGFGSAAGGNGSAGLALINRMLFDGLGGNLAELIYDGVGDDRADIKNGRPHSYDASTQAEHHNHVHAAVYGDGTNYVPGDGYAYLHQGEAVVPASANQGAPYQPQQITLQLDGAAVTRLLEGHVVTALTAVADRGAYNG